MMAVIVTTNGFTVDVDEDDLERLSQYRWSKNVARGYVTRSYRDDGRNVVVKMHRELMGLLPGDIREVDHINHVRTDNRKSNLRVCTVSENRRNRRRPKNNKSGFKGVFWKKRERKWVAQIGVDGKKKYLGVYSNPKDAHEAYKRAAIEFHGEFANFG